MPQTFMRSLVVLVESTKPSNLVHLTQGLEQIGVQELIAERAVEALCKSVTLRLAFLCAVTSSLRFHALILKENSNQRCLRLGVPSTLYSISWLKMGGLQKRLT